MTFRMLPVLILASALVLAACSHDFRLMQIEEHLSRYGDAIRWRQLARVAEFQSQPVDVAVVASRLDRIDVSSYTPLYRQEQEAGRLLVQAVEIRYVRQGDLVERRLIDQQRWRYQPERGSWLLESDLPRFD